MKLGRMLAIAFLLVGIGCHLFKAPQGRFTVVVLGAHGGLTDGDLSAYLVARKGTTEYLCLDAGTVLKGITEAARRGSFKDVKVPKESGLTLEGHILQDRIKAYALSHAHLDHMQGLVIDSTDDTSKQLLGLDTTIDHMRDNMFNWILWPNFGNEGERPLNKYVYERMQSDVEYPLPVSGMNVTAFKLRHSGHPCTAFLVRHQEGAVLYLGDTGPDAVEGGDNLEHVWQAVAPLVRQGKLRGLFLECSFPNGRKDNELFGHLTPAWMHAELARFARAVDPHNPTRALRGLPVVVTHVKPSLKAGDNVDRTIEQELKKGNQLGVRFIMPRQGDRFDL